MCVCPCVVGEEVGEKGHSQDASQGERPIQPHATGRHQAAAAAAAAAAAEGTLKDITRGRRKEHRHTPLLTRVRDTRLAQRRDITQPHREVGAAARAAASHEGGSIVHDELLRVARGAVRDHGERRDDGDSPPPGRTQRRPATEQAPSGRTRSASRATGAERRRYIAPGGLRPALHEAMDGRR